MSKEQLQVLSNIGFLVLEDGRISLGRDSFDWLIKQAERAQELEEQALRVIDKTEAVRVNLINTEQQNKRYEKALNQVKEELTTILEVEELTAEQIISCADCAREIIYKELECEHE